jgi:hypothetical protein
VKRAFIVIMVALLIASVSGIKDASLALQQEAAQPSDAHERDIASRVNRIGVNHVVRIERADGSRSNALLEDVLPDGIVVTILDGQDRRRETIPFAEISKIDEVRGHTLRNVLIGVGIGVAVLVGTCAVALSSGRSSRVKP